MAGSEAPAERKYKHLKFNYYENLDYRRTKGGGFQISRILQSNRIPYDEFRTAIIGLCESYNGELIPSTVACLFEVFGDTTHLLALDSANQLDEFTRLKGSGSTSCFDLVSIQRAAWCYQEGLDVLKYSYQNGGGSRAAVKEIKSNRQFQKFLLEKCTPDL